MCGIFGYARLKDNVPMSKDSLNYAIQLLTLDNETRGKDSTGIATVNNQGNIFMLRKVKQANTFLKNNYVLRLLEENLNRETRQVLGHTRYATTGAVNLNNSQPFIFKNILGTHNGVINNYKKLFKKHKLRATTTCDSEVIFALLSTAETLKQKAQVLSKLRGYYSVAFHDSNNPDKIYFAVGSNVLSIFKSVDGSFIFWSSEEYPIRDVATYIPDIELEEIPINDYEIISIDKDGSIERENIPIIQLPKLDWRMDWFKVKHTSKTHSYFKHTTEKKEYYWSRCAVCNKEKECTYSKDYVLDLCRVCSLDFDHKYGNLYDHLYDDGLLD